MEGLGSLAKKSVRPSQRSSATSFVWLCIGTGFGLGYLPLAPGTWASLATVITMGLVYAIPFESILILHVVAVVSLFALGWIASEYASKALGDDDPSVVVIDEIFGQMLPFLFIPVTPVMLGIGFGLFRFFDVVKPPPVRQCERFRGGLGIMMDDLAASLYTALTLWLIHAL